MSHELRTPLNAVIGFSDMLTQENELMLDGKRRNEYAGLINDSGKHLLSVVNGILDMSKIETGNFEITPEPFAPAQVVASCCSLLALRASEAGVRLEKLAPADLPDIVADKRAVQSDLAQPRVQCDPLHRSRRHGDGLARAPKRPRSLLPSRTTASASAKPISRASASRISRLPPPTTAATRHRARTLHRQRTGAASRRQAFDQQPHRGGHARHRALAARLRARAAGQKPAAQQPNGVVSYLAGHGSAPHAGPAREARARCWNATTLNLEDIQVKKSA